MSINSRPLIIRRFVFGLVFSVFIPLTFIYTASADVLEQNQTFFIDGQYDSRGRSSVNATLKVISNRAYGYVENSYVNSITPSAVDQLTADITELLNEFDNRIYPIETQFFGSEPNPGIDNDPRITILFAPLVENAGGYFANTNVYPKNQANPASNEREMFYINVSAFSDQIKIYSFVAHEFQHLISFNQKEKLRDVSDDVWLNETRSEYAVTLLGYNDKFNDSSLERRLQSFLGNSSDSLTEWKNLTPDYSSVALFGEYLAEHWPPSVLADSLNDAAVGIPSVVLALTKNGISDSFLDIFGNWLIAGVINDSTLNPKFGYSRDGLKNFRVKPSRSVSNLGNDSASVISDFFKDWQPRVYEISNFALGQNKFLRIKFSSPSLTSFDIIYLIVNNDGSIKVMDFRPDFKSDVIFIDNIGDEVKEIILMPIKKDKLSGFTDNETAINLSLAIDRVSEKMTLATPAGSPIMATPEQFGLKEGDFIRAEGQNDVYIINSFGYKRLILNPQICLQYGHLGARGCFEAVKVMPLSVVNAFRNSFYFTNGETGDGRVYRLDVTGEDAGQLRQVNLSGDEFISQGGNFQSVFMINSREQNSYSPGLPITRL